MPEEEVTGEQGQVDVSAQAQAEPASEPFEDVVEGFEQGDVEEDPDGQAAPQTADPPPEPDLEPEPEEAKPDPMQGRMQQMEAQIHDLNRALHQERQKAKEQKAPEQELSDADIDKLMLEYRDDPATMRNLVKYIAKQEARKADKEAVDTQRVTHLKSINDSLVTRMWPEIQTNPTVRNQVETYKQNLNLEGHPMADHLAASAWVSENLQVLQKQWYESGVQAGLKGKVETARKEGIKTNSLAPPNKTRPAQTSRVSSSAEQTFKQMGLSAGAIEIAKKLVAKKSSQMAEV